MSCGPNETTVAIRVLLVRDLIMSHGGVIMRLRQAAAEIFLCFMGKSKEGDSLPQGTRKPHRTIRTNGMGDDAMSSLTEIPQDLKVLLFYYRLPYNECSDASASSTSPLQCISAKACMHCLVPVASMTNLADQRRCDATSGLIPLNTCNPVTASISHLWLPYEQKLAHPRPCSKLSYI